MISAAHCFCNADYEYCQNANDKGEIINPNVGLDPDIIAILGLTSPSDLFLFEKTQRHLRHLRRIVQVLLHSDFIPTLSGDKIPEGPDIALLKMDRPVPR